MGRVSPEPGQGAALRAGLGRAAKRGREAAGEQPQAKPGRIQRCRGKRSQRSAASGDCGAAVAQSELGMGIRAGTAAMAATLPHHPAG